MRILLDECVPRRFLHQLPDHHVRTSPEMGWASYTNGDLLAAASVEFDVLVTTDRRLSYQQSLSRFDIAVIVLIAHRNKLEALLPLVSEVLDMIPEVKPGEVYRVGE